MKNLFLITLLSIAMFGCTKNVENSSSESTNNTTSPAYKSGLFTLKADNVWDQNNALPKISVSLSANKLLLSDTASPKIGFFRVVKYDLANSQVGFNILANFETSSGGYGQLSSISFASNYLKDPNETQITINARPYDDIYVVINRKRYKGDKLIINHEKGIIDVGTYEFSGYADSGHTIICKGSFSFK
jgi:hypothetical protein